MRCAKTINVFQKNIQQLYYIVQIKMPAYSHFELYHLSRFVVLPCAASAQPSFWKPELTKSNQFEFTKYFRHATSVQAKFEKDKNGFGKK